jgi:hypothetical protein
MAWQAPGRLRQMRRAEPMCPVIRSVQGSAATSVHASYTSDHSDILDGAHMRLGLSRARAQPTFSQLVF